VIVPPDNPLPVATEATPPAAGAVETQVVPLEERIFPELPGATTRTA